MHSEEYVIKYLKAVNASCNQIKYLNANNFYSLYADLLKILEVYSFRENAELIQKKLDQLPSIKIDELQYFEFKHRDEINWDEVEEGSSSLEDLFPSFFEKPSVGSRLVKIRSLTRDILYLLEHPGLDELVNSRNS